MEYTMIDKDGRKHDAIPETLMPRLQKKGWMLVGESGNELQMTPITEVAEFMKTAPIIEEKKSDVADAGNIETIENEPEHTKEEVEIVIDVKLEPEQKLEKVVEPTETVTKIEKPKAKPGRKATKK